MKCFYHYEKDSTALCSECNHPLCQDCLIDVKGVGYCRDCLEKMISSKDPETGKAHAKLKMPIKSSTAATWLSIVPGLGLIYLELYLKGIAIFTVFIGLVIALKESSIGPMIGWGFWLFQLIYTNQEAKRMNRLWMKTEEIVKVNESASLLWGGLVILVGFIFLIDNFGFDMSWLYKFWPLLIVGLGIHMVWNFFKSQRTSSNSH